MDLDSGEFLCDTGREFLQTVDSARCKDQFEILGSGACEFESCAASNAGGGAGDEDGLAFEAFRYGGHD